jgi:hypothetical protein
MFISRTKKSIPSNSSERVETLETFSWILAFIFVRVTKFNFSYVSNKNEIKQVDNLYLSFCLLEYPA